MSDAEIYEELEALRLKLTSIHDELADHILRDRGYLEREIDCLRGELDALRTDLRHLERRG